MANRSSPTTKQVVAYASPGLAYMAVSAPVVVVLPALYSKHAELDLAAIGAIFVLMRLFDAVSDPLIGFWSDKTETRIGARKPWTIGGAIVTSVSVLFLFSVPSTAGVVYFGIWSLAFYLGMTMFHVPHMAWGRELAPDYSERATVFSIRGIMDTAGGMLYTVLPIFLFYLGISSSTEFSLGVVRLLGIGVALAIPLLTIVAVLLAPGGAEEPAEQPTLRGVFTATARNTPLLRFLSAYLLAGAGTGCFAALIFPFIDGYLGVGDRLPHILLAANIATLVSLPLWPKVIDRIGKHRSWAIAWILNATAMLLMALVPQGPYAGPLIVACFVLYGLMTGGSLVAPFALLADVIDYDILKTNVDRSGNYYAFIFLLAKTTASVGGLALVLLGAVFGYEMSAAVNSELANLGLVLLACVVPAALQLAAIPIIWNFPIDRRRHAIIRRRLDRR